MLIFVETVPFAVVLLWVEKFMCLSHKSFMLLEFTLVVSRLFHAFGMLIPKRSTNRFHNWYGIDHDDDWGCISLDTRSHCIQSIISIIFGFECLSQCVQSF